MDLPTPPSADSPATFVDRADEFLAALDPVAGTEPGWAAFNLGISAYEEEVNLAADPDTPMGERWRHRPRPVTGQPAHPWSPGRHP